MKNCHLRSPRLVLPLGLGFTFGADPPWADCSNRCAPPWRLGETSKASRDSAHEKLLRRERGSAPGRESGEPCRRFAAPRPPFLRPGSLPSVAAASGYGVLSMCCVRRFWRGEGVGLRGMREGALGRAPLHRTRVDRPR